MAATLSDVYLSRAGENLRSARRNFGAGDYHSMASDAYYAAFHAATALLLRLGFEARTHGGVRMLFGREAIRKGLVPEEFGKIYTKLYDFREKADYPKAPLFIERDEAESVLGDAERFVMEVGRRRRSIR